MSTSRYLRYAIGEILLVVVGILIALSIDNWNENRKERIQLEGYLRTIQKNIQADTVDIKFQNKLYQGKSVMARGVIRNLFFEKYDADTLFLALPAVAERYVRVDLSGFESLKNSGYISKLQGTKMADALFDYYNTYNRVLEQEISLNNYIETMEAKLFDIPSETLIETLKLLSSDLFDTVIIQPKHPEKTARELYHNSHIIGIMQRTADENSNQYVRLLKKAEVLLALIEEEIN